MKKSLIFCLFIVFIALHSGFSLPSFAQAKKKRPVKKKTITVSRPLLISVESGAGSIGEYEPPKYISLEPCAKETNDQIAEVENAKDAQEQISILSKRLSDKDDWTRACAVYRLGDFGKISSPSLPLLIKIMRDDKTDGMFSQASDAIYKISPDPGLKIKDWLTMAKDTDVYTRIYGVWALGYYNQVAGTFELKDTVNTLIEATKDEDVTVQWVAVTGISRLGVKAKDAVPALMELIQKKNMNPNRVIMALGRMEQFMLPAAPLLFDVLYNPGKYTDDKDFEYSVHLSASRALAGMGNPLIPVLEKEFDKEPLATLKIAQLMFGYDTTSILLRGLKHQNKGVRKEALSGLIFVDNNVKENILPTIIELLSDLDLEIRKEAASQIGSIASNENDNSPELTALLNKKALPAMIKNLSDKEAACMTALSLGHFGAAGEPAIPALVKLLRQNKTRPDFCAERALFELGDKGRAFLSKEKIKELEESEKSDQKFYDSLWNKKPKKIAPKVEPKKQKTPDTF